MVVTVPESERSVEEEEEGEEEIEEEERVSAELIRELSACKTVERVEELARRVDDAVVNAEEDCKQYEAELRRMSERERESQEKLRMACWKVRQLRARITQLEKELEVASSRVESAGGERAKLAARAAEAESKAMQVAGDLAAALEVLEKKASELLERDTVIAALQQQLLQLQAPRATVPATPLAASRRAMVPPSTTSRKQTVASAAAEVVQSAVKPAATRNQRMAQKDRRQTMMPPQSKIPRPPAPPATCKRPAPQPVPKGSARLPPSTVLKAKVAKPKGETEAKDRPAPQQQPKQQPVIATEVCRLFDDVPAEPQPQPQPQTQHHPAEEEDDVVRAKLRRMVSASIASGIVDGIVFDAIATCRDRAQAEKHRELREKDAELQRLQEQANLSEFAHQEAEVKAEVLQQQVADKQHELDAAAAAFLSAVAARKELEETQVQLRESLEDARLASVLSEAGVDALREAAEQGFSQLDLSRAVADQLRADCGAFEARALRAEMVIEELEAQRDEFVMRYTHAVEAEQLLSGSRTLNRVQQEQLELLQRKHEAACEELARKYDELEKVKIYIDKLKQHAAAKIEILKGCQAKSENECRSLDSTLGKIREALARLKPPIPPQFVPLFTATGLQLP